MCLAMIPGKYSSPLSDADSDESQLRFCFQAAHRAFGHNDGGASTNRIALEQLWFHDFCRVYK
jgi:hypothetical protein